MEELRVIGCSIEPDDVAAQKSRVEHLVASAIRSRREPDRVEVWFSGELDERVLHEFTEIESACCPFFRMDWDAGARRLAIEAPGEWRPALDAMAEFLGV